MRSRRPTPDWAVEASEVDDRDNRVAHPADVGRVRLVEDDDVLRERVSGDGRDPNDRLVFDHAFQDRGVSVNWFITAVEHLLESWERIGA